MQLVATTVRSASIELNDLNHPTNGSTFAMIDPSQKLVDHSLSKPIDLLVKDSLICLLHLYIYIYIK